MATVKIPGGTAFKVAAANFYLLSSGDDGLAGGWLVQIHNNDTWVGTIKVKAQALAALRAASTEFEQISYRKGNLDGTAADWSYVTTDITTDSLIFIPNTGMAVGLEVTRDSGSFLVYSTPVIGAASF